MAEQKIVGIRIQKYKKYENNMWEKIQIKYQIFFIINLAVISLLHSGKRLVEKVL